MNECGAGSGPGPFPELLAPAGSVEALHAAVAAGADAVYLGGKRFGARHFAANFSMEEIREAVTFAHTRGVKVYVTANTLIHDRELPEALDYLLDLFRTGVDAVLVQDKGLAALSRLLLPGLALHASTQCTISGPEGVRWAKSMGFSRVVLARETTLEEIDLITAAPPEERTGLEVFIHGALCYSYSGQCLLSSVMGGRSGNRGMCAQPCRKPYRLVKGKTDRFGRPRDLADIPLRDRFLLSTRDLCVYPRLTDLIGRGVESLKIEGRMRSPEYVAVVVSAYREAMDGISRGAWSPSPGAVEDMAICFSRGFSCGYLMGDSGAGLMGRERPDNRGLHLGKVIGCPGRETGITIQRSGNRIPDTGDGLVLVDPRSGKEEGLVLRKAPVLHGHNLIIPAGNAGCRPGNDVYLTSSVKTAGRFREIMKRGREENRSLIPIDVRAEFTEGQPPVITGWFTGPGGRRVRVEHHADFVPAKARTRPLDAGTITLQMRKTGESPFFIRNIEIEYKGGLFIPIGELNRIRREFLEKSRDAWTGLSEPAPDEVAEAAARIEEFRNGFGRAVREREGKSIGGPVPRLSVCTSTLEEAHAACGAGCDVLYLEPREGDPERIPGLLSDASGLCEKSGVSLVWKWPGITGTDFLSRALLLVREVQGYGIRAIMVEEAGIGEAILAREPGMEILGGRGLNIFNHRSAMALHPPVRQFRLSPELTGEEMACLTALSRHAAPGIRYETYCQGNLEVMVSRDDLPSLSGDAYSRETDGFLGIRDGTGRIFPVYADGEGRTHILNAVETCLVDHLPALASMGISSVVVDARSRGPEYAREMTAIYRDGLALAEMERPDREEWEKLKAGAAAISRGGITTGHFLRGIPDW